MKSDALHSMTLRRIRSRPGEPESGWRYLWMAVRERSRMVGHGRKPGEVQKKVRVWDIKKRRRNRVDRI